jgi:hypothetical protein
LITSVAFPLPVGIKFAQWGSLVAEQLAEYGILAPSSEEAWQDWAAALLYVPDLASIPDPYGFDSWDIWASRLLEGF